MLQGFYNLTSNMITQNRNLNVISTNMANVATPGYKSDRLMQSTFREEMMYRHDRFGQTPVGTVSWMNVADERVTDYTGGGLRETGNPLDVGLTGNGFFVIQSENGPVYSRNGSFILDDQGYLTLPGIGRVMGTNGPIQLTTDEIAVSGEGDITSLDGFQYFGRLQLVDFTDYTQLVKITGGVFRADGAQQNMADATVTQKYIESSNVSMAEEMTSMMTSQRALQSSSQILKMYDQILGKAIQAGTL